MLLRNYDNMMSFKNLVGNGEYTPITGYGDGYLGIKNWDGNLKDVHNSYGSLAQFSSVSNSVNKWGSSTSCNLICGYDNNDVNYDDYKIETIPSLNFVKHSFGNIIYDDVSNTFTREYTKTYNNSSSNAITINCTGVAFGTTGTNSTACAILIYKEKLPQEIEIPAGASITLKFKTTVTGNPNKPIEVSTSVE